MYTDYYINVLNYICINNYTYYNYTCIIITHEFILIHVTSSHILSFTSV